ncbi:hypothetical protein DQ238_18090 [Geodermatophilus sp. TF02-6]|nr:hypothetical protein DQ238_18090 [Geodermatophilus sp. TF02-6]
MPTSTRLASQTTSRACAESSTRRASAGETSVTMSTSPSVSQTSRSASSGVRSLRKTARSIRGPRAARFQWSRLASSTTCGSRCSLSTIEVARNGAALMTARRVVIEEAPWTRVNGPVPHGPGSSITYQWPSPEPNSS